MEISSLSLFFNQQQTLEQIRLLDPAAATAQTLKDEDTNKDNEISPEESSFTAKQFSGVDTNQNGLLNADELLKYNTDQLNTKAQNLSYDIGQTNFRSLVTSLFGNTASGTETSSTTNGLSSADTISQLLGNAGYSADNINSILTFLQNNGIDFKA